MIAEIFDLTTSIIIRLGTFALIIYFIWRYLGSYIEIKLKQAREKVYLAVIKEVGKMTNEGIDVSEALEKSLSITNKIEQNLKLKGVKK